MERFLTLLRHAKSSWADPQLADFDRPLNERGKRDAPEMGRRLAARGLQPNLVLTSPAKRARKTARKVARKLGLAKPRVVHEAALYLAEPGDLRAVLSRLDPSCRDVLVVGHNPGITDFANELTGADIDNVPTTGAVRIRLRGADWSQALAAGGALLWFDYPKRKKA
ncbi:MAG TPA: histidine phosphatase family protein [Chromatiales bacterium]|nr:histidine phosphatase family protein [Chromatiales bacterium]